MVHTERAAVSHGASHVQGDPSTKMLITSTCFQRITLFLVHMHFSVCMIIPQSSPFVGQIIRLLSSLQNVFQVNPLALQAHLQAARETANNTNTFLCVDCPDSGCNCCFQVSDCLGVAFVHSVLQIAPKVNIWGI